MAADMIQAQLARELFSQMQGQKDDSGWEALGRKLEEIANKAEDRKQQDRPMSPMEMMMEWKVMQQMMREIQREAQREAEEEESSRTPDLPSMPMPQFTPQPRSTPAEDMQKMMEAMRGFMPPPQQQMTPQELMGMFSGFAQMVKQEDKGPDPVLMRMLESAERRADKLEDLVFQRLNQPPESPINQMKQMAEMFQIMQQTVQGETSPLAILAEAAKDLPDIIEAYGNVKRGVPQQQFETEEDEPTGQSQQAQPKGNRKVMRALVRFKNALGAAKDYEDIANAIVGWVRGLCHEKNWRNLFISIAKVVLENDEKRAHGYIKIVLDQLYQSKPPKGMRNAIVKTLRDNHDTFAEFVVAQIEETGDEEDIELAHSELMNVESETEPEEETEIEDESKVPEDETETEDLSEDEEQGEGQEEVEDNDAGE
jgi:hypothetical protein